jgi:hypothetical protein
MIVAQIILVIVIMTIVLFTLFGRQTSSKHAWKKLFVLLLAALMIFAIVSPRAINDLAHLVGVGRGADLLLYFVTVAFVWFVLNDYLHQQREKDTLYRLARKVALIEAFNRYKINGQLDIEK